MAVTEGFKDLVSDLSKRRRFREEIARRLKSP